MDALDADADVDGNQQQACFVLHRGITTSPGKAVERKANKGKGPKQGRDSTSIPSIEDEPASFGTLRMQAFINVWGRIQKLIEDIIEQQNQDTFEEVQQWICNRQFCEAQQEVFKFARVTATENADLALSWPKAVTNCGKQLHTALLFLGGVDPSDHQRIFKGLTGHLKVHNCHVARLTSVDFSSKAGVGGPLRSLFRQLIPNIPDTTDMDILLAWHQEEGNEGLPLAIVIENAESCDSKVLSEFFVLLSEWIAELPIVLVMGMATTGDAVRKLLPASTLTHLHLWRFSLKSPPELLELAMRAVILDSFCAFELGCEVLLFLYGFFQSHDLTVTSIIRTLKVACMEHFWKEPLSFLCERTLRANSKVQLEEQCAALPDILLAHASAFPSVNSQLRCTGENLPLSKSMATSLWELRAQKRMWGMAFQCLHAVGKQSGITFGELLCEVLQGGLISKHHEAKQNIDSDQKDLPADQLIIKLRDMQVPALKGVLEEWRTITLHEKELNAEVSQIILEFSSGSKPPTTDSDDKAGISPSSGVLELHGGTAQNLKVGVMNRSALRKIGQQQSVGVGAKKSGIISNIRRMAEDFLRRILREHMVTPDHRPYNEIFCFKDVNSLKQALMGETRKRVHMDLINSRNTLQCQCCPADGELSSSLHDTTLAYILSQDYGDLIKVHNWYQSFAAICDPSKKNQSKVEPKRKRGRPKASGTVPPEKDEPSISVPAKHDTAVDLASKRKMGRSSRNSGLPVNAGPTEKSKAVVSAPGESVDNVASDSRPKRKRGRPSRNPGRLADAGPGKEKAVISIPLEPVDDVDTDPASTRKRGRPKALDVVSGNHASGGQNRIKIFDPCPAEDIPTQYPHIRKIAAIWRRGPCVFISLLDRVLPSCVLDLDIRLTVPFAV